MTAPPPPVLPPPLPPEKRYNARWRLPLSLIGLMIALSPAPIFLLWSRDVGNWMDHYPSVFIAWVGGTALAGSYLGLRALIPKRWIAVLCCPFMALAFLAIDGAVGIFIGCIHHLGNM